MRASKYSPEFRERAVRLARESERPISAVARDLGVHPESLRVWVPLLGDADGLLVQALVEGTTT